MRRLCRFRINIAVSATSIIGLIFHSNVSDSTTRFLLISSLHIRKFYYIRNKQVADSWTLAQDLKIYKYSSGLQCTFLEVLQKLKCLNIPSKKVFMKDDFSGSEYRISYAFFKEIFIYQNYTIKLINKERLNRITTLLLIIVVDNRNHLFISTVQ